MVVGIHHVPNRFVRDLPEFLEEDSRGRRRYAGVHEQYISSVYDDDRIGTHGQTPGADSVVDVCNDLVEDEGGAFMIGTRRSLLSEGTKRNE